MMEKKVHVSWTFQEQNPGKPWKLYQIPGISMEFHVIPWISSLSSMITLDNVHPGDKLPALNGMFMTPVQTVNQISI